MYIKYFRKYYYFLFGRFVQRFNIFVLKKKNRLATYVFFKRSYGFIISYEGN